jgi:phage terminase large subunit-like protein
VTTYARQVVNGAIVAGRLVRLACERHLRDLRELTRLGYRFAEDRADDVLEFFPKFLRLYDAGEKTGEPFVLGPAWVFIVGSLFGWLAPDGYRRFRTAYVEMGKGNAKTPGLAGIGLYGVTCDGEPGAQVLCAAVTREQARILFDDAKVMASVSPALLEELVVGETNIAHPASKSFMRPVSSEGRSLDAKRVHMALIDEVHEHESAIVVNKLTLGTKGRRQALVAEITNAGYDRQSVCWEHHQRSRRVLEGLEPDESWFAYVCGLDPCEGCRAQGHEMPQEGCPQCDDWRDERTWIKANPNLDISVTREYLRKAVRDATAMPSMQNLVRRLNFCTWTESVTRWFTADQWAACGAPVDAEALKGRPCVAGADLATTQDLAALVLCFPDDDFFAEAASDPDTPEAPPALTVRGGVSVLAWFWCPEEGIRRRSQVDRVPYELWRQQGSLEATPGAVTDHRQIRAKVNELRRTGYDIREWCYDPAFATQLALSLRDEDGFTVVSVPQTHLVLNEPATLLERLVLGRQLRHGGHPVLAWNAANAVCDQDAGGRKRPSKGKSTERIDGMSALVTGLKRLVAVQQGSLGTRRLSDFAFVGERRASATAGAPWE